ncbi:MAG: hypothetical protein CMQ49_02500 [Gammaproteobacteria bacterium]|nr:hypothetical protein [Gammaproteobacteria bacterium]|tara:strand:- start:127 stop:1113 length:987 start_codon:yes stop_codon:yes gene_type:complete
MRKMLTVLFIMIVLLFAGWLLLPGPDFPATAPLSELADSDSRFIEVEGLQLHYKKRGSRDPIFLLLHGFGASLYTWREIMSPMATQATILAYDRPAFGLTERPMEWGLWNPYSDSAQVDIALALLDHHRVTDAILVGNSAGGTVAVQVALRAPERVRALVLISPAIYQTGGLPGWVKPLMRLPPVRYFSLRVLRSSIQDAGNSLARLAWHDPTLLDSEIMAGYGRPLRVANWDVGLWNFILARERPTGLVDGLAHAQLPLLIVTGDDDRVIPTPDTVRLASEIGAPLIVLDACGHVPQEECPDQLMEALDAFVADLPAQHPTSPADRS